MVTCQKINKSRLPCLSSDFILSIEILGLKIKQKDELKGLNLGYPNKLVKTVQYADDSIAFLNNKNELCTVSSLIGEYGKASGIKLNLSKCEGIWLGVDKTFETKRLQTVWNQMARSK